MVASKQYIDEIVDAFAQATQANLDTPARQGNVIVLTTESADEVMITGDLHGHRRNFNLIKKIASLDKHPRRHLVLQEVCHGGPLYLQNSGCMSHTILEDVAMLKNKYPDRVHFILGNHELAELTDFPIQKNKQLLNVLFRLGLQQMYGQATEKIREAYLPFVQSCPLAVRLPHGVFISHSIPEYCDSQGFDAEIFDREIGFSEYFEQGGIFQLVWGRDHRRENAQAFAELVGARILINGHEPCHDGFAAPNDMQIIIDCCSDNARYVILPTNEELSHAEILKRVQKLQ
jgi:hypothetical protein